MKNRPGITLSLPMPQKALNCGLSNHNLFRLGLWAIYLFCSLHLICNCKVDSTSLHDDQSLTWGGCSQTRTRSLHASNFRIAVSAGFHVGGCLSCACSLYSWSILSNAHLKGQSPLRTRIPISRSPGETYRKKIYIYRSMRPCWMGPFQHLEATCEHGSWMIL